MKQDLPTWLFLKNLFEKYRKEILQSRLIMVEGKLQIEGEVIHVIVKRVIIFQNYYESLRHQIMKTCHY